MASPAHRVSASASAFWRLLGDYERICHDETTALHGEDFQSAATIQALKPTLLAALEEHARELGIDRRDETFHARIEAIADAERDNDTFVKQLLARNEAERKALHHARLRLRGMQHSYVVRPSTGGAFFARG